MMMEQRFGANSEKIVCARAESELSMDALKVCRRHTHATIGSPADRELNRYALI